MRVLVTRPRADSESVVRDLAARGHDALIEPLLDIRVRDDAVLPLDGVRTLLVTSANGVRAFAGLSARRDLRVFAVGEASAEAARAAGFADVTSAGGDAHALAQLVCDRLDPSEGALLHAAGSVTRGELAERLAAEGFDVRRVPLYEAVPAQELSESVRSALSEARLDAVVFFSPRTARTFASLVRERALDDACGGIQAVCLSQAVADAVRELPWRRVHTAEQPDRAALLRALDRAGRPAGPHAVRPDPEPAQAATKDAMTDDRKDDVPEEPGETGREAPVSGDNPALAIIQRFGGIRPMAHKLGVAVSTVQGWKNRGAIPESRHEEILQAARTNAIDIDPAELRASGEGEAAPAQGTETAARPWAAVPEVEAEEVSGPATGRTTPGTDETHAAAAEAEAAETAEAAREAQAGEHAVAAESEAASRAGDEIREDAWGGPAAASAPPRAEPPPPPKSPGGWLPGMFLGAALLVAGVAGAIATRDSWLPYMGSMPTAQQEQPAVEAADAQELESLRQTVADLASQVSGLEDQLAEARQQAQQAQEAAQSAAAASGGDGGVAAETITQLRDRLDQVAAQQEQTTQRLEQLAGRSDGAAEQVQSLADRVGSLASQVEQQAGRVEELSAAVGSASTRIDKLADTTASAQTMNQLGNQVESLQQQVQELSGRSGARAAARQAAAGLAAQTLAVAELRDALRFSAPFAQQLSAARDVVAADGELAGALDSLAPFAEQGVPTRAELANGFDRAARQAVAAAQGASEPGLLGGVLRRLNDVVTVRRVGAEAEGDGAEAVLARAEAKLDAGNLGAAVETVQQLSDPAKGEMSGWVERAQARLSAERALSRLSGDLMSKLVDAGAAGGDSGSGGGGAQ